MGKIENILPHKITKLNESDIKEAIDIILKQWPSIVETPESVIKCEALLWKQKWLSAEELPKYFIDSLNLCNKDVFPNIFKILKHCATLPTTVASSERSFSTLKRIKTYLRNSTGESRLNGLAALSIHRDVMIDCNDVIDMFKKENRRMNL